MKKIALIIPFSESQYRFYNIKDTVQHAGFTELYGYLKKNGHIVNVFDFLYEEGKNKNIELNRLHEYAPDIVIISAIFRLEDIEYIKQLNISPKCTIIGYGVGVLDYEMALRMYDFLDYVIPIHNEIIVKELLSSLIKDKSRKNIEGVASRYKDKILFSPPHDCNLDEVFDGQDCKQFVSKTDPKMAYITSSRGCWYAKCTFCTIGSASNLYQGKKWFTRDIKKVVQDIIKLYHNGINKFHFMDTEFIGPGHIGQERASEFARLIINSGIKIKFIIDARIECIQLETFELLKKAGLERVFLGVESGCNNTLCYFKKGQSKDSIKKALFILDKLKINIKIGSILAAPQNTLDDIEESLDFILQNHLYRFMGITGVGSIFHQLHLHSGTPIYKENIKHKYRETKLGSEIPPIYKHDNVTKFIKSSELLQQYIIKSDSIYHQKCVTINNHHLYKKYAMALRIISINLLKKSISILKTNSDKEEPIMENDINSILSNELQKFDVFWNTQLLTLGEC